MLELKKFWCVVVVILFSVDIYACDGCGINLSNSGGNLLNINNRSYVSLFGSYATFDSSNESHHTLSDRFVATTLNVRYGFHDNWSLFSGISYQEKTRTEHNSNTTIRGIGDWRIGINYSHSKILNETYSFFGEMGLAIGLPTSKYHSDLHDRDLPQNFNLGNGALSFGWNAAAALKKENSGLLITGNYQLNNAADNGYDIGNSITIKGMIYHNIRLSDMATGMLNTGLQYEGQAKDRYANGNKVTASGSKALHFIFGLGITFDKITIQGDISRPLTQNYINHELDAKPRLGLSVIYFLN